MLPVNGIPILGHMIERLKTCKSVNRIIVATTTNRIDEEISSYSKTHNVLVHRGSEIDVLSRYYDTMVSFKSKIVVRLTSDCPLVDPHIIDDMLDEFMKNDYDYMANTCPPPGKFPNGMDVEIFTAKALSKAHREAKMPSEREHVTFYFWKSGKFKCSRFEKDFDYSQYRITLDYLADYILIREIISNFKNITFSLDDIIMYLRSNPSLIEYQNSIDQNAGWYDSLIRDRNFLK
jgi:spore coat polysaccharide biosynthesis protein SpsF (cytidylyltransferase family)